jgi:hypothetical protein
MHLKRAAATRDVVMLKRIISIGWWPTSTVTSSIQISASAERLRVGKVTPLDYTVILVTV